MVDTETIANSINNNEFIGFAYLRAEDFEGLFIILWLIHAGFPSLMLPRNISSRPLYMEKNK